MSKKEYQASIDVSMGGRVAEELSEHEKKACFVHFLNLILSLQSLWQRKRFKWCIQ